MQHKYDLSVWAACCAVPGKGLSRDGTGRSNGSCKAWELPALGSALFLAAPLPFEAAELDALRLSVKDALLCEARNRCWMA